MVRLKVCGITSYDDARAAIECGAEYLGFNFYPPSPRFIAPNAAREIITRLPETIMGVGIFVNETEPEFVIRTMRECGLRFAQLHGDEDTDYCARVGAERVIKALRVSDDFDRRAALDFPASAILLDAYDRKLYGGTGRTTDWEVARELANQAKVFLAGGLSPDNIAEAVRTVRHYAVDVNSGVESAPGRKDAEKLRRLAQILNSLFH